MHKKILRSVSIVLTAALLFSILTCAPFSVGAAEADGVGAVAADEFDYFGELSNGRYTLESQTYALTEDFLAEGYLYVPSGVEATIDLNGKTLKREVSSASANGSVIKNEGTLTISDSSGSNAGIITGGYAEQGGAVNNLGELTINGGTIEKNKGSRQAGAVYNTAGATLTVNGGVIRQNISGTYGGGAVVNSGTMTVTGGAFTNNEAPMNGGAIWNGDRATLTLKGGSITGNVAGDRGSGIFNRNDGVLYVEGSPVVKDNAGGNLFLNNSRLSFSGSLSADAQIDISTDLSGSVTSSFVGDVRGVTFANGHTAAKLENGELVPDLGAPTMVSTWAELENAVNNAQGEVSLALANNIVNTELHQRLRVPSGTNANVTIDLCGHTIDVNRADQGSADQGYFMWVDHGAAATVKDSRGGGVITGGNATGTTGGIHVSPDATLNLYNVRLNNNKSSQYGGAIFNCGALTVESSVIANNTADARGGAMYIEKDSTSVSITGTRITGNKAGSRGGAIYQYANDNKITSVFTDCFINGNTQSNNSEVDSGSAIFLESGNITMNGGSVCGNSGNDAGAAMIIGGTTFKATGTRFNSNESRNYGSGAFSNAGTLELTDCQVNNNTSHGEGAAFHNRGTATVTNSELNGNTSGAAGGAIYILTGSVKLTDSTLSGNRANSGNGSAIHSQNGTNLKIFGCHITNNTCTKSGGGMYIINGGFTEIYYSEFTGNTAGENGGGIYLSSKTQLNVVDSTVSGNTATSYAGGIFINDESESKLVVRGLLNFSGNKLNTGAASNVYLTSSKTIEIYWHPEQGLGLDPASQIGITAANYNRKLTTSLRAADESDLAPFTLDSEGESYGFVKSVSDGELYVKKIDKTSVNSWDGLQNAINNGDYEKYITLSDNITASGSQTRIRIYDGDTVTIDLHGKKLNRGRSSKDRDGHVIEVKGGGRLTVVDSVGGGMITGGYANNGGGVNINEGGSFIFESGQISGNKVDDGGVYVHDSAAFTMKRDAVVTENTASDEGGGVFFDSPETITGGRITKNTAKYGGAVYFDDSDHTLSLRNVTMRDNTSTYRGGAVYVWHGTVELVSCTVSNNTAKDGGAAYITSKCTLDAKQNTRFESNKSTDAGGGAIVNMETLNLNGCTFTGNTAKYNGGAVYSNKNAAITNCTFTRNTSTDANGGAVFVNDGNVTLESCTIRENIAAARAAACSSTTTPTASTSRVRW